MELINQWPWLIIALLSIIPQVLILFLVQASRDRGTDHCFHVTLIEQIRRNRNRFVSEHGFLLIRPEVIYPQLVHWFLSLLPSRGSIRAGTYLSVAFSLLSTWALIGFAWVIHPDLSGFTTLPVHQFIMLVLLVYVLTPYSYSVSNAKNMGMSGRGIGLFCCELYLYLMVLHLVGHGSWLLIPALLAVLFILVANIFAMQYILFSAPVLAILLRDWWFLVIPLIALVLFLLLFRRYAVRYLIGQWHHKRFYSKHLAERYILRIRPSIWRDLIRDFWVIALGGFKRTESGASALAYFYTSPIVILVLGIPALSVFVILGTRAILGSETGSVVTTFPLALLSGIVLVGLALFVATSFRKTRFLGEPERYVEVGIGALSILVTVLLVPHPVWYLLLIGFSFLYLALNFLAYFRVLRKGKVTAAVQRIMQMREQLYGLLDPDDPPSRLLSNDTEIARSLMDLRLKVFWGITMSERMGGMTYHEIFSTYSIIRPEAMAGLARSFEVDFVVVDTHHMEEPARRFHEDGLDVEELLDVDGLLLFRVRRSAGES